MTTCKVFLKVVDANDETNAFRAMVRETGNGVDECIESARHGWGRDCKVTVEKTIELRPE